MYRRVYIDRDENKQIASIVQHAELTHSMRIGTLIFVNVGQILPHQLQEFHTANFIYPVGYKVVRKINANLKKCGIESMNVLFSDTILLEYANFQ